MATSLATPHPNDIEQGIIESGRSSDEETVSSSDESCTDDNEKSVPNKRKSRSSSSSSSSSTCYLSECSVVDLESSGGGEAAAAAAAVERGKVSVHSSKVKRDCRICHLSLDGSNHESGFPIELGCSCKEDLGAAHKHCAETWFKIRGNKTCEICGSTARNVVGVNEVELMEPWNEANDTAPPTAAAPPRPIETRHFWQGHKFLNFLLACMVFAFVISWLFHFNVPS